MIPFPTAHVERGPSEGARQNPMLLPLTPCIPLGSSRIGLHCAHGPSTFRSCAACKLRDVTNKEVTSAHAGEAVSRPSPMVIPHLTQAVVIEDQASDLLRLLLALIALYCVFIWSATVGHPLLPTRTSTAGARPPPSTAHASEPLRS